LDHPNLTFLQQDIRSPKFDLDRLVQDHDLVIDLIAYANPGLYLRIPLEVFRLNFTENLKIAEACVRHGKRLIQFSTCEVYGRTAASLPHAHLADPEDPIHATFGEDTSEYILGPVVKHRWIYSCAKQLLERVLHAYGIEQGFNYTIIRPFNFIGPKIDFLPQEKEGIPRVFSFFMDALLTGGPMKLVNGGVNRRCYTYIDDAVECSYRIVQNPGGVCDRQIFNIGSPYNEVSIRQMAETMREIYAHKFRDGSAPLPEIVSVPGEEFYGEGYDDSDRRIPDITKARTLLGWEPVWSMRATLEATMEYYVAQHRNARAAMVR
jgi:UDP-apiose/xylose synthase